MCGTREKIIRLTAATPCRNRKLSEFVSNSRVVHWNGCDRSVKVAIRVLKSGLVNQTNSGWDNLK